jgi:LacI family transcriptional regulator
VHVVCNRLQKKVLRAAVFLLFFRSEGEAKLGSQAVGVLTQNIASSFYGEILRGIEHGFRGTALHPLFTSAASSAEARHAIEILTRHRACALIVIGGQLPDDELRTVAEQVPLLAVGRTVHGLEPRCLRIQNSQGAFEATRHLLQLGHREIVHVAGIAGHPDAIERRQGYERALAEGGLPVDPKRIVPGAFDHASGRRGLKALLDEGVRFTAVFAANDEMAFGACVTLHRQGRQVPHDVSVVGFDDHPLAATFAPPLTTVRQPTLEMGSAVARFIVDEREGKSAPLPALATELVVRESTGPRV